MSEKWKKRHLKYEHFNWNTFTGYIIWESSHLCVITLNSPQPWYEMLHFNHICIQLSCWLEHLVLKQFFSFGGFFCFNIRMLFTGNMSLSNAEILHLSEHLPTRVHSFLAELSNKTPCFRISLCHVPNVKTTVVWMLVDLPFPSHVSLDLAVYFLFPFS